MKKVLLISGLSVLVLVLLALGGRKWILDHRHFVMLFDAAGNGDVETVKDLVREGAPINRQFSKHFGWTPLICAIFHEKTNVINFLLEAGADPNMPDHNGETPLLHTINLGDGGADILKNLLAHGASLDSRVFSAANSLPSRPTLIGILESARSNKEVNKRVSAEGQLTNR